ncbi:MAG: 30S ribosomal protein S9 [Acidimicrobiia bacterium]|nr:30S ribosomal protein S9 [Acidimicrobiia bacterium]
MSKPLVQSTGRRKSSVARVRLHEGTGRVVINDRSLEDFFPTMAQRIRVLEPLRVGEVEGRYDVYATVHGGGTTGQTDALRLGIARGILELIPELRPELKSNGLLTRDARRVERKKYGLRKARRAPQYTKR